MWVEDEIFLQAWSTKEMEWGTLKSVMVMVMGGQDRKS
jgi:hypothetical protein